MERLQSKWEHRVAWNLAESGVHPLRVEELVESERGSDGPSRPAARIHADERHGRASHADCLHLSGRGPEHVQVTNGGSEANCITLMHLLEPGDDVIVMMPNYMQVRGLARGLQANVTALASRRRQRRRARRDGGPISTACAPSSRTRTRAILVCNPNNPTGARLTAAELDEICAHRRQAWRMDRLRRDLPRRRAGWRRDADDVGAVRAGDRYVRPVESLRPARTARGLARCPSRHGRPAVGLFTTTRRSHRARSAIVSRALRWRRRAAPCSSPEREAFFEPTIPR